MLVLNKEVCMAGVALEVKTEILTKVKAGEKVADLSKQYGISEQSIYSWLKQTVTGMVSILEHNKLKKENNQLKQIIGVLTLELEKTKKNRWDLFTLVRERLPTILRGVVATVFGFVRASGYYQPHRGSDAMLLREQILSVLAINPGYGHRRIVLSLRMGKKRIRRVMKYYGIKLYKRKSRWRKRRDERRAPAPFANLIKSRCLMVSNHSRVGDFTYLPFKKQFLYLATFMDLYTRKIVGWHLATRHTKELVMEAFLDGLVTRKLRRPRLVQLRSERRIHQPIIYRNGTTVGCYRLYEYQGITVGERLPGILLQQFQNRSGPRVCSIYGYRTVSRSRIPNDQRVQHNKNSYRSQNVTIRIPPVTYSLKDCLKKGVFDRVC